MIFCLNLSICCFNSKVEFNFINLTLPLVSFEKIFSISDIFSISKSVKFAISIPETTSYTILFFVAISLDHNKFIFLKIVEIFNNNISYLFLPPTSIINKKSKNKKIIIVITTLKVLIEGIKKNTLKNIIVATIIKKSIAVNEPITIK